jgi:PAS domain S-box-containing protein
VLDTGPDPAFDALTRLAAELLEAPCALINLVEEERNWFLSRVGVTATHLERREDSLCADCMEGEVLVVPDAAADARFAGRLAVRGPLHVRFYAGVTLLSREGAALGTLCVFGPEPRALPERELARLEVLARQVEAQLELRRHAHERDGLLRLIVEQSADGIIVADAGGTLRIVNPAAQAQHGMPPLEVPPARWTSAYGLYTLEGRPLRAEESALFRALQGEAVRECCWRVRRPDGSERILSGSATPLRRGDGRLAGALLVTRDETERHAHEEERGRLLEELRAALRAREDFLTAAAHELRTPLTSLHLKLHLLTRSAERLGAREPLAPRLGDLERQARRLSALVEDLCRESPARLAALGCGGAGGPPSAPGAAHPDGAVVDLAQLAGQVVAHEAAEAARAGCALALEAPGAPVEGAWDASVLEEVLGRLLANALKFGAGHPVRVGVAAEPDGGARLSVTDGGPGVSESDAARLFQRFGRGAPLAHFGGMGLGLYRVRTLVEGLGGRVSVERAEGGGARFVVRLPRRVSVH